jgi:hypothetical protein
MKHSRGPREKAKRQLDIPARRCVFGHFLMKFQNVEIKIAKLYYSALVSFTLFHILIDTQ